MKDDIITILGPVVNKSYKNHFVLRGHQDGYPWETANLDIFYKDTRKSQYWTLEDAVYTIRKVHILPEEVLDELDHSNDPNYKILSKLVSDSFSTSYLEDIHYRFSFYDETGLEHAVKINERVDIEIKLSQ